MVKMFKSLLLAQLLDIGGLYPECHCLSQWKIKQSWKEGKYLMQVELLRKQMENEQKHFQ